MGKKLYILRPVKDDPQWEPWYDKAFGFVVCATSHLEARKLAQAEAGDETQGEWKEGEGYSEVNVWLDPVHTSCTELKPANKSEVIMQDFHAA